MLWPTAAPATQEQETDKVIDRTAENDKLFGVTCSRFDDPDLALPPLLLKGLQEMRPPFIRPSKIQAASLPKIWQGRELLAQASAASVSCGRA